MPGSKSKRLATERPANEPPEFEIATQRLYSPDNISRLRLQYLVRRLHALGPKPLFHFLDELERGANLRDSLERYAQLPADFIRAYGGDKFGPPVFAIRENAP